MISDLKRSYEEKAEIIPNWRKANKNDLANKYIENESDPILSQAYLSALICRYWGLISKHYNTCYKSVSIDDCYDWLINSITYALKHRKWLDPQSKMYGDPAGPDKIINRCMLSSKRIFFQASNYMKRTLNFKTTSVDALIDDIGDFIRDEYDHFCDVEDSSNLLVNQAVNRNNYFLALIIDVIAHFDTFESKTVDNTTFADFSMRKLVKCLRDLDDNYIDYFEKRYSEINVDRNYLKNTVSECKTSSSGKIYNKINSNLQYLKNSRSFINKLKG